MTRLPVRNSGLWGELPPGGVTDAPEWSLAGEMADTKRSTDTEFDSALLSAAYDSVPIAIAVWTVEGRLVHTNPVAELILAVSAAETPLETLIQARALDNVAAGLLDLRAGSRNHVEFDMRCRRPDGAEVWLRAFAAPVYGADGRVASLVTHVFDFAPASTAQRQREESLRLVAGLTEAGPVAVLHADVHGEIAYLNGRWADLVDSPDEQLVGAGWRELIRAEDADDVIDHGRAAMETGEPFTVRIRPLPRARTSFEDGANLPWAELRVAPTFGSDGTHTGFVGIVFDVSIEMEAAARADRLAAVLDASLDYVLIALPGGAVTYANDAAANTLGVRVSPDDPTGSFIWDLLDTESTDRYLESIETTLSDAGSWRGELTVKSAAGGTVPVSAQILAHRLPDGRVGSMSVVARDISDLKDAETQLRDLATHDRLTGLANRALLYDRVDQALAREQRLSHGVALMYCDLDDFKPVNDRHGHDAGDAVLISIAQRIKKVVRDTDTAARVGGDEFVVLVEGVRDVHLLEAVAHRLIDSIVRPVDVGDVSVGVSVSVGLCVAANDHRDADELMGVADAAMYRAKAGGPGRLEIVVPGAAD